MPSAKRSAIRSGASGAVMSSSIASPSISAAIAPSSSLAWGMSRPVSYTHLTLPTICSV